MNHLWQSTLFAAVAGLLTLALRNNRASVRYWLWFAASVKFLIPFSLLVTLGSNIEWRKAPVVAPLPVVIAMNQVSQPFPSLPASNPQDPINIATVLVGVWLAGFCVVAFRWALQWSRVRAALRSASPLPLNLPIRVLSSSARIEPGVFGVFRPILLLPDGIIDRLTPAQWDAILAHELCHVRRRDNLTAAIHMAVEAIFWFHPLVWWIGKRMMEERERACDEEVILADRDPETYAQGILNVCKFHTESPLRCMSGAGSNLKKRVRAIMTQHIPDQLDLGRKLLLVAAGMASIIGPIAVGILKALPLRAQSPPPAIEREVPASPVEPLPTPRILAQNLASPTPNAPKPQPAPADPPAKGVNGQPPAGSPSLTEFLPNVYRDIAGYLEVPTDRGKYQFELGTGGYDAAKTNNIYRAIAHITGEITAQLRQSPDISTVETYVIGATDVLAINVFGERGFTRFYPIQTDGTVTIPFVGAVKAAGLTPLQLQQQLTDALSQFIKNPEGSVTVSEGRPTYSVVGTVKHPGNFPLVQPTTVFEALNEAGGFTQFANERDIVIIRGDQRFHFNYKDYVKGENVDPNITLQAGDTILVK
jgi:beta-lactamase regulating signal transducer with metallopeptidase domain